MYTFTIMGNEKSKTCDNGEFREISTTNVPAAAIDFLKPVAKSRGYPDSDAGVARFSVVWLAELIKTGKVEAA